MTKQNEQILEIVKAMPGSRLNEISALVDFRRQSVSARLSELKRKGQVRHEPNGTYYIGDGTPPKAVIPKKLRMKPEKVEKITMGQKLDILEQEVAELLEWKAEAIRRYPDLAVSKELLAARQVAIDYYSKLNDQQKIKEIRTGKLDETPLIQVALLAMSS